MNNNQENTYEEDEIDLLELFATLWRGKFVIIFMIILCVAMAVIYLRLTDKTYEADALIQVKEAQKSGMSLLLGGGGLLDSLGMGGTSASPEALINSRLILGQAVDTFGLKTRLKPSKSLTLASLIDPVEFVPESEIDIVLQVPEDFFLQDPKPRLKVKFLQQGKFILFANKKIILDGELGAESSENGYTIFINSEHNLQGMNYKILAKTRLEAIEDLRADLSIVEKEKGSGFFALTISGQDPDFIDKILNYIAVDYIDESIRTTSESTQRSIEFIDEQLPLLHSALAQSEELLSDYMSVNASVNLGLQTEKQIEAIAEIEAKLSQLRLTEDSLSRKYTQQHPSYQTLLSQRSTLLNERSQLMQGLLTAPQSQQELIRLRRNMEINQQIYLQLLRKGQELKIVLATNIDAVKLIDSAQTKKLSKYIKPKTKIVLAMAMMLGIFFGFVFVLLKYALRKEITGIKDLENRSDLSVLATIPASRARLKTEKHTKKKFIGEKGIAAITNPDDEAINALRKLRSYLHLIAEKTNNNCFMLSHLSKEKNPAFIGLNTAILLAETGKKVLLLDMNNYASEYFQPQENKIDIPTWLKSDNDDIHIAIHKTEKAELYFGSLPADNENFSGLLLNKRFDLFFKEIKERFDMVFIDSPSVLNNPDLSILANYVENNLVVVKKNTVSFTALETLTTVFKQEDTKLLGVIWQD